MRYGNPNKLYSFYQFQQNQILQKAVPEWRIKDIRSQSLNFSNDLSEYRRIAAALLDCYKALPPIKVKLKGTNAQIRLEYRLQQTEEDFFKLYSWPNKYYTSPQIFSRIMSTSVYLIFRQILETVGYQFEEE